MQVHCANNWAYLKTLPQISRHLVAVIQNYARALRLAGRVLSAAIDMARIFEALAFPPLLQRYS